MFKISTILSLTAVFVGTATGQAQVATPEVEISVVFKFDAYPGDISWSLENTCHGGSEELGSGGPYTTDDKGQTVTKFDITTTDGSFKFTINDSFADGLCCKHGDGGYTINYGDMPIKSSFEGKGQEIEEFGSKAKCKPVGGVASYDPALQVPKCASVDPSGICTTSGTGLLECKGTSESNGPNTLFGLCADGESGLCKQDESIEDITVTSSVGALSTGTSAKVTATIYSFSTGTGSEDQVDFYHANDLLDDIFNWTHIGSAKPSSGGKVVVESEEFTLGSGAVQAVRVNLRWTGGELLVKEMSCSDGNGLYDDVDDLLFAVDDGRCPAPAPKPPNPSYPSEERLRELSKHYDFEMLDAITHNATYDDGEENLTIQMDGLITNPTCDGRENACPSHPNYLGLLELIGTDVKSVDEVNVICASKCSTFQDCSFFTMKMESTWLETKFFCFFYRDAISPKDPPLTRAVLEPLFNTDWGGLEINSKVVFRRDKKAQVPPLHPGCDISSSDEDIGAGYQCASIYGEGLLGCLVNGTLPFYCQGAAAALGLPDPIPIFFESAGSSNQGCAGLLTSDFWTYMAPAAACDPSTFQECFGCLTKVASKITTGEKAKDCNYPCEKNLTTNVITAISCKSTETPKKDECVCDPGCGSVCPARCLEPIQSALLCVTGATARYNNGIYRGGCIHANVPGYPDVLEKDFSCAPK